MKNKVIPILMGVFVALFTGINLFFYFTRDNEATPISGAVIGENLPWGINMSLLAFILQWVILLVVVIFAYMRFLKHKKEDEEKIKGFFIPKPRSKAETNFDVFYRLLQEKKSLNTSTIAKAFSISKEQALEWGKILEEHNLAVIEYPAFSDPEIMIEEKKEEVVENGEVEKKEVKPVQKDEKANIQKNKIPPKTGKEEVKK